MAAAMVGGTAYVAGKAGSRRAQEEADAQQMEYDQDARLSQLEAQQQPQQAPPMQAPAPATAPPTGGPTDIAAQLTELKGLMDQGVLSPEEFQAAKQKLLAG